MLSVLHLSEAPDVLTVEEAAQLLRIGRNSAYQSARTGELPTVRIGRRLLVPKQALIHMFEAAAAKTEGAVV